MTSTASAPNGAARTAPPPVVPLKGAQLALGTLALSLATFMNVLDSSIANVAIPAISGDVGVSPSQGTWVITSFGVANAISVPLTGWLTQRFGAVRLFTMSVLLFVLTSWLCGFASSLEMLVLFRVLQGAVAGPMIPLSQTLLLSSYPPSKAGTALALWGVTTLVAPVVGPLLGGWITDNISWPWIFYINVPVGLLSALMTWSIYRHRETPTRKLPIDTVGLSLLVLWVGALQLMLDKGKELDWFASGEIIAFTVIAVVAFAVFVVWELTDAHPVVDLRLFKRRNFAAGSMALSIAYGVFFGNVVLLPLWLQQWMGYTSTAAGLALAPVGLLAIVLTPLVGRKVGIWDPRKMATGAFIVFALVLWMRSQFTVETDFRHILVPTLIQGAAMAFFFIPLTTITLSGLTPDRIPAAAGLSNFVRITAGAMGTSIATTLWESRAAMHHAHLTELLVQGQGAFATTVQQLQAAGMSAEQAYAQINRLIDQQAFTRAADDIFLASSFLFLSLIVLIWFTQRPKAHGGGGADAAAGAH
ncbi:DHA2 family efflux MFS transporter permease subunit [Comamonas aquatica]|mgnify:CR=1 FL=1|uniref:DHA2 family efflux MFS transporter permease subunit n=1 Tax=Comamonas aquatica TaxID=225991 RepID=UPI002447BB5E|nr:DHA2 family efflux MFS transporter permease subunit [Comamonas aquatica]MDH1675561.1 DHA2 family efflux MFS transporter permease subunit [Comamonas aquatica]MDH1678703.1 DHA2 family efflux MFS transporter permease subunit [Comamonas aquatica]